MSNTLSLIPKSTNCQAIGQCNNCAANLKVILEKIVAILQQ